MKNENLFLNVKLNRRLFLSALVFMFSFLFFTQINAQTTRPSPTPRQDIPQVVSRDDDLTNRPDEADVNEISESIDSSDTVNLPRQNSTNPPKEESTEITTKKQKQMMLYLDLLTKTEQRAAGLRQQVFEMLERQNETNAKLKQTEYLLRPEVITSATALSGSLRPEDLRDQRKATLELEKANLEATLRQIEASRSNLEENLRKAELLVERIRLRFEKAVDDALNEDEENF